MTGVHPLAKAATPSTSPTMTTFVFIAAPPNHIANDFLTIKRNGFTKVTKRKLGGLFTRPRAPPRWSPVQV
jgi:hypothetical protein